MVHLGIINGLLYWLTPETYLFGNCAFYINISWLAITTIFNFYPTKRKEKFWTNFGKVINIFLVFALSYYAMLGYEGLDFYSNTHLVFTFVNIYLLILLYRVCFYWARDIYRVKGGNSLKVVVLGRDQNLRKLRNVFDSPDYGYRYMGYFAENYSSSNTYLGKYENAFDYILKNDIEQIYVMLSSVNKEELQKIINFANNNFKRLKIIPDNKDVHFTRSMKVEIYNTVPVLIARECPMHVAYGPIIKRAFDIVFSSFVIVFVLSWLTPIIYLLMRLDSKGPLIFKQQRSGINKDTFWCYKFRSMTPNENADTKSASKNDMRVTRLGKILRKTSLDELPQFINVFLGHMSVVGPRPHMQCQTQEYELSVDEYLVRHSVKPGITGLAQIKGYRGEIIEKTDIINRVRLDIFYLEKWSINLDIIIIIYTMINAIRGEEKAY